MATLVSASPVKRQGPPSGLPIAVLESPGSITSPDAGTFMTAGEDVAFDITVPEWNHCHPAYTPVNVYLLDHQPTASDLNSTYGFSDFLHYFGEYMVINVAGMPSQGTPPPSTLQMPNLEDSQLTEGAVFLAVIETIEGCPPDGFWEYAIDSVQMGYIEE